MRNAHFCSQAIGVLAVAMMTITFATGCTHSVEDRPASTTPPVSTASASTTSSSSLSRVETYDSVKSLADASDVIVIGTVTGYEVAYDIDDVTPFTLFTLNVESTIKGDVSGEIIVRETGDLAQDSAIAYMSTGGRYLVYLVESGLDGDLASQYYVTGVDAGIYKADDASDAQTQSSSSETTTFTRLDPDSGDALPATLTAETALGD